jgi:hypothetical protein
MSFLNLPIKLSYAGKGEKILNEFLLPVIKESVRYNRVTSFYTVESLLAISQGLDELFKKKAECALSSEFTAFLGNLSMLPFRRSI